MSIAYKRTILLLKSSLRIYKNTLSASSGILIYVAAQLNFFFFLYLYRFRKFESSLRDVSLLLENWDRCTGNVIRVETPKSETEPEITQTGSNKKMRDKKGDKEKDKEKEKEREREKEKEKEKEKLLKEVMCCIFVLRNNISIYVYITIFG